MVKADSRQDFTEYYIYALRYCWLPENFDAYLNWVFEFFEYYVLTVL